MFQRYTAGLAYDAGITLLGTSASVMRKVIKILWNKKASGFLEGFCRALPIRLPLETRWGVASVHLKLKSSGHCLGDNEA